MIQIFATDRGIAYFTCQSIPIFPDVNHLKCKNNLALEERKKTFKQVRYIATEAITQDWTWEEKKIPAGKEIHQKLAVYLHNYRNRLWKNLSQNCYKTLGMKKGNSSVRNTAIIISIISVISFLPDFWQSDQERPLLSLTLDLLQTIVLQNSLYWNKDIIWCTKKCKIFI